jgi:DNA invertase Pin-like site-specific DNA recombinase
LERKQVDLQMLDQNIDTTSATGRLLFNMLGAIAQFETEIRAERQREGIQKARERGVKFGKRKKLNKRQVAELQNRRSQGVLIKTSNSKYGTNRLTLGA